MYFYLSEILFFSDYTATKDHWKGNRKEVIEALKRQGMDEKTIKSMLGANPAYLQNTVETIDKPYGSMDKFLTQEMELTPQKIMTLRSTFLQ
ncbi:tyrosine-protein phosphatase [Spirosoma oryzicola]|uniref:tyrosine-protein phosphatase n=1 Tax=Spirosoma oryzicola TaxID=2898794 RepID=UPI001E31CC18|nr:tyrosine-protein phosphatase [Spirosoma oryzicola]UHG93808.1 tyrosine-protein phosphatase [Spirosoma oryzicola]